MAEPPSIDNRYPRRRYVVRLENLLGWPQERLLAELGNPDEQRNGNIWPVPKKPGDGSLSYGNLVLGPGRRLKEQHVFGVFPTKIQFPTPYQTWTYRNVEGSTWVLYLTQEGLTAAAPAEPSHIERTAAGNASLWNRIWSAFGRRASSKPNTDTSRGARPDLIPPRTLKPSSPLRVAEVKVYGTGAKF